MRQKILVIVGPTASGKSALAVALARRFNGEVISADSRQMYRGLDIGTGKITKREMRGVAHHLLNVASPKTTFTAHDFIERGRAALLRSAARRKLPIICGGTGFYIDALLGRIGISEVPPNPKLRAKLRKQSPEQLFALLKKKDPSRAQSLSSQSERNNNVRLIRALEIASRLTKDRPLQVRVTQMSHFLLTEDGPLHTKDRPLYDVLWIGIMPPLRTLERKIRARLRARIESGMIAEARRLHAKGLSYKRMEALGLEYRSLARLLQNKISRTEFERELFRDIRRYAKKQIAYWKRNPDIAWFPSPRSSAIIKAVQKWMV